MTTPDNAQDNIRKTFGISLWEEVVKPLVETAERHRQFETLSHYYEHLVSLFTLIQSQHFRPDVTEFCLVQTIHTLEQTIETLRQEINDTDDTP